MLIFAFNGIDYSASLITNKTTDGVAFQVFVDPGILSFKDGPLSVQDTCVKVKKSTVRQVGTILFVVELNDTVYCLFQTREVFAEVPDELTLKENQCVFFEKEMIQLCFRFLKQQKIENMLPLADSISEIHAVVESQRLLRDEALL